MLWKVVGCCLLVGCGFVVSAQSSAPNPGALTNTNSLTPLPEPQVAVLKAQLAEMQAFRSDVLGTVWWALGVLGTVTVVVAAYGWATNERNHARDREALRSDVAVEVQRAKADLLTQVAVATTDARNSIEHELSEKITKGQSDVLASVRSLQGRVRELAMEQLAMRRERDLESGALPSSLAASVEYLTEAMKDASDDYFIGTGLDYVADDLGRIEAEQAERDSPLLDSYDLRAVVDVLSKATGAHAEIARKLKDRALGLKVGS